MKEIKVQVTGRVQGVFFRDFVREMAEELGLGGWVKNTSNGGVSLLAQGEEKELKTFINLLGKGPESADVQKVECVWCDSSQEVKDFKIIF